ncbi:MAG: hypothetical protein ACD_56C00148G0005 [uncultured bacterium]|nr:MAG: hypothetical protein ACD_56C00148G0005 [uncultured bacterium]
MKIEKLCSCTVKGSKDYNRIEEMEKFLQVLSDRTRLKILCLLKNDELNVKNIYHQLGIKQTLASHHLTQLKKLKLLKERKSGASTFYSIDSKKFEKHCKTLGEMIELDLMSKNCCSDK